MVYEAPYSTDEEIITELTMIQFSQCPYALIVEGPDDANLLRFSIRSGVLVIHSTSGRQGVLSIVKGAPKGSAIGLVDRDYHGLENLLDYPNLKISRIETPIRLDNIAVTEQHDLQMDAVSVLRLVWLRNLSRILCNQRKNQLSLSGDESAVLDKLESLLESACDLAFEVAVLRVISIATGRDWNFAKISAARWATTDDPKSAYEKTLVDVNNKTHQDFDSDFGLLRESFRGDLDAVKHKIIGDHELFDIFAQLIANACGKSVSLSQLKLALQLAVDSEKSKFLSLAFVARINCLAGKIGGAPLIE